MPFKPAGEGFNRGGDTRPLGRQAQFRLNPLSLNVALWLHKPISRVGSQLRRVESCSGIPPILYKTSRGPVKLPLTWAATQGPIGEQSDPKEYTPPKEGNLPEPLVPFSW